MSYVHLSLILTIFGWKFRSVEEHTCLDDRKDPYVLQGKDFVGNLLMIQFKILLVVVNFFSFISLLLQLLRQCCLAVFNMHKASCRLFAL